MVTLLVMVTLAVTFTRSAGQAASDTCTNSADGQAGTCVLLETCPHVWRLLNESRPVKKETVQLLMKIHCGFQEKKPMVCCSNVTEETSVTSQTTQHPTLSTLPMDTCGYSDSNRILRPPNTLGLTDVRPTMARLSYGKGSSAMYRCGGSLITTRYVLTAAHCVTDLPQDSTLEWVVLGEFTVDTDPDCMTLAGDKWCRPPLQRIRVEKIIPHPEYNKSARLHDIALVKLQREVAHANVTELITLCLPVTDVTYLTNPKDKIQVMKTSGWGTLMNGSAPFGERMYGIMVPTDTKQCQSLLKDEFKVTESHICVTGSGIKDATIGDTGGPLMAYGMWETEEIPLGPRLVQIGVETFTPTSPSVNSTGQPSVYTSVSSHLSWILDNV